MPSLVLVSDTGLSVALLMNHQVAVVPLWPDGWASLTQMGPKTNRFCLSPSPLVPTQTPGLFPMSFSKENKKQYTMVCCGISTKYILFGVGYSLLKRRQVTNILQKMQLARGGNSNTCNLRPVVLTSLVVEQPGNSTVNCTRHV